MAQKKYQWDCPHDWLHWRSKRYAKRDEVWHLRSMLRQLANTLDHETIQDAFASQMVEDGYFEHVEDDGESLVDKALEAADEQEHQRQERIEAEQASTRRVIRGMIETTLGDHVDIESLVDGPTDQVYLPGNPTLVFTRTAPTGSSKLNVRVKGAPRKKQRTVYNLTDVGKAIQNMVDYLPPEPPEPPDPPAPSRWCPRCRNDLWIQDINENSEHFRCNYCLLEGTLTIE